MLAIAIVAGLSTQLAVGSGQALRHSVPQSAALRRHVHIAGTIRPLILALFLVALATMLLDRRTCWRVAVCRSGERVDLNPPLRAGARRPDPRRGRRYERALVPDRGQRRESDVATGASPNQRRAQRVPRPLTRVESGRPIRSARVYRRRRITAALALLVLVGGIGAVCSTPAPHRAAAGRSQARPRRARTPGCRYHLRVPPP